MTDKATEKPSITPPATQPKLLEVMSTRLNIPAPSLYKVLKNTVFRGATDEEFMSLMVVSNQYNLNPILKQIYAFPQKGGGIVPVVSIDGWVKVVNSKDDFDGCDFDWQWKKDGNPMSCTCVMYHKNRSKPVKVTEYFDECKRTSEPWKNMPRRMLRHKAYIQAARYAFGLSGIYDEDEARDIASGITVEAETVPVPPAHIPGLVDEGEPERPQPRRAASKPKAAAKPKARPKPEPEPEPEPEPPPEEPTSEEPEPPPEEPEETEETEEDPEDLKPTSPLREISRKMVLDNIGEDQVLAFCTMSELCDVTALENVPKNVLMRLLVNWKKIVPELQEIQI